jgi:biopolymer transport protein ExbD
LFIVVMMIPQSPGHHGPVVDLADSSHAVSMPGAIREDAIRIMLTRDGSLYFRNQRLGAEDLPDQIRESLNSGAERKAYLNVDSRTRYADVEPVLDEIRHAGIAAIALFVEQQVPHR